MKTESLKLIDQCFGKNPTSNERFYIRWMIRRDMPSIMAIEDQSFEFPWTEEQFIHCLRQRACIGMVAEIGDELIGYMIYLLHRDRLELLNFAVHPGARRLQVGTAMVDKLKGKLQPDRRSRIQAPISESNLAGQLFFKAMGFHAISVLKEYYYESTPAQDAYLMEWSVL